jgi:hypothetical protein
MIEFTFAESRICIHFFVIQPEQEMGNFRFWCFAVSTQRLQPIENWRHDYGRGITSAPVVMMKHAKVFYQHFGKEGIERN